jgi:hypothetical protein
MAAEAAEHGGGFLYHGQPTVFPPGYPALLALLMRLHLAYVWVIVCLSVVFLAIGLVALRYLLGREGFAGDVALGVSILTLLSFVFVKYSAIPLSDPFYFALSMCSLAAMKQPSRYDWRRTIAAVVLLLASISVRRIGVALIPALVYMLVFQTDLGARFTRLPARMKGAAILTAAAGAAAIAWAVRSTSTLRDFKASFASHTVTDSVLGTLIFRLKELGEIALNVPAAVLPTAAQNILPVVGALVFCLVCGGLRLRRKQFGAVEAYFITYVAIIMVWPFYDPRFWLPVIPLLIAYSAVSLRRVARGAMGGEFLGAYVIAFAVMGLVALAATTSLTFSGDKFPEAYGYREFHSTYCVAWHRQGNFDPKEVDQDGLYLLRKYK